MNEQEYFKLKEIRDELNNAKYQSFCNTISYSHFETMVAMMNRISFHESYSITCSSCMMKLMTKVMNELEKYEANLPKEIKENLPKEIPENLPKANLPKEKVVVKNNKKK